MIVAARVVGLVLWFGMLPALFLVDLTSRVFWTVLVASLPLFWVLGGYYTWRRVCPLAAISRLPAKLGRPGTRKANDWLARNSLFVQLGLLLLFLTLRLLGANGTPWVLAAVLVVLSVAALGSGFVFRGKTWCNYICPVGFVERVYAEPVQLIGTANSQCATCTACKKSCPDIDQEQAWWKEPNVDRRRAAYFAWPGVVLGFYTWWWLRTGTWDAYFDGRWTTTSVTGADLAGPGLFFASSVPWLVSAPLTLITFGAVSWGLFAGVERAAVSRFGEQATRTRMLVVAGFVAVLCFYVFAGQPTLRLAPGWVVQSVGVAITVACTVLFLRRWSRTEKEFVREKFARRIVTRWKWGQLPEDGDFTEVYVLHAERKREREERVAAYGDTVRELVADGVVTRETLSALDAIRAQLKITDKEHDRIVQSLEDVDRARLDPAALGSAEQRLQEQQYRRALVALVEDAAARNQPVEEVAVTRLRVAFGVGEEAHARLFAELRDPAGALTDLLLAEARAVRGLARISALADADDVDPGRAALIRYLCRWEADEHLQRASALRRSLELPNLEWSDPPDLDAAATALGAETYDSGTAPPSGLLDHAPAYLRGESTTSRLVLDKMVALRSVELLRDVGPRELQVLTAVMHSRTLADGAFLCRFGETEDDVFVITAGEARVWHPEAPDQTLSVLAAGTCVGELAALDPAPRSAHVTARGPLEVVSLPGDEFRDMLARHPDLAARVIKELTRRLRPGSRPALPE